MGPVLASNRCALSGATRNVVANISRGSVLPQDLPGVFILPAWASRVHSSHAVGGVSRLGLRYVGGVLGCTKCGGFATTQHTQSPLSAKECRGQYDPKSGTASRIRAFERGEVPAPWHRSESWPDEQAASTVRRWPLHLSWSDGRWMPLFGPDVQLEPSEAARR